MKALLGIVLSIALGYLMALGYLRLNEGSLVYQPGDRAVAAPPAELPVERITIASSDSVRLGAWVIPAAGADSSAPWLLICHGNYGNISFGGRPTFYLYVRDVGFNQLAFDYRGFGESEGSPSEAGFYRDAVAAYEYLRRVRRVAPERILIYGHSLGAGVATELATRVSAAGVILEGAFTSVPDRGQEIYPFFPVKLVASQRFASIDKIDRVSMPKLFLHSPTDDIIPIAHGRRLFAAAPEPKRFVEVRGGHNDAYEIDRAVYYRAIEEFAREVTRRTELLGAGR